MGRHYWTNWACTYKCTPEEVAQPTSTAEVQRLVQTARTDGKVLKAYGGRHSPNDIVCTNDILVDMSKLNQLVRLDGKSLRVRVQGGMFIRKLNEILDKAGFQLCVQSSIVDQSVAGIIATATHGTGMNFPTFSSLVTELQIVNGLGEIVECDEKNNADIFAAARCHLGVLGIVTEVGLMIEPKTWFYSVNRRTSLRAIQSHMFNRAQTAEHYRVHWFPHTDHCVEWRCDRVSLDSVERAAQRLIVDGERSERGSPDMRWETPTSTGPLGPGWDGPGALSPSTTAMARNCARLMMQRRGWLARKTAGFRERFVFYGFQFALRMAGWFPGLMASVNALFLRLFHPSGVEQGVGNITQAMTFDCLYKQYTTEWAVPAEKVAEAMDAVHEAIAVGNLKMHAPFEIRFTKADDVWLSPCYQQDSAYIGIVLFRPFGAEPPQHKQVFQSFEARMRAVGGRPHWAKEFDLTPEQLEGLWPRYRDFWDMQRRMDPHGVFLNPWARRYMPKSTKR